MSIIHGGLGAINRDSKTIKSTLSFSFVVVGDARKSPGKLRRSPISGSR